MVQRDTYNFNITASNQQAKDSFEELKKLAGEVEKASSNLGKSPGNNEHISSLIKSMSEASKQYNELKRAMSDEIVIKTRMEKNGSTSAGALKREMEKELKQVSLQMQKVRNTGFNSFKKSENVTGTRVSGRISTNPNMYESAPTQTRQTYNTLHDRNRQIKADLRRATGLGRSAIDSRYINHSSASSYRSITGDLLGPNVQGADIKTVMSGKSFKPQQGSFRAQAEEAREFARTRNRELMGNMSELHSRKDSMGADEFTLQMNKINAELADTEKVVSEATKGLEELDKVAKQLADQGAEIQRTDIREKADRDTIKGRMSERAFSVGLAVMGSALYTVGSQLSKGAQTVDNMRSDSISVGMRTNDYDFRSIRQEGMDRGNPLGYKGQDMLGFSESVLTSLGYKGQDNLVENADNIAEFSKFSGAGEESSTAYIESLLRSGGIGTSDQAKAIQEAFVGAIKASGMEGREKEQIDALTMINDSVTKGREASEEEIRNRTAMSSVLANTGNRAFQGNNLANAMGGMDDMLRGADPFSTFGMLMGVGSKEELSNDEWLYNLTELKQGGMTPELFNDVTGGLSNALGGNTKNVAAEMVNMGLDVDVRALHELLAEYPDGLPVGEEAEQLLKELQKDGGETLKDREEAYMDSPDQTKESQQAYQAQLESLLNDNKWMDMVDDVKEAFSSFGAQNAGTAGVASIGGGLMTGASTMIGSAVGGMISHGFMKMISDKFVGGSALGGAFNGASKTGGMFKGLFSKGGEMLPTGGKSIFSKGGEAVKGLGSYTDDALSAGKGLFKSGGMLSKGAGMLGKIAPWLAVGTSALEIATADDKVRETGKQAGALGGAFAGAKAGALGGAALGSFVPGIGNAVGGAIGGAVGGIGGWFGGSKLGDWVGEKTSGWFGGDDKEPDVKVKGAYQVNEDADNQNEMSANSNEKVLAETLRTDNVNKETENISRMEAILVETKKLLAIAASQNGILGGTGGVSGASSKGSPLGNGEYWTNTDLTKHDLGSSPTGLTADEIDKWINDKAPEDSVMRGKGKAFMTAGTESGLDPRYLVAHAAHETAWGTSNIAKNKGNMYGIGAFDSSPYKSAYGYNDTEAGIVGGAKWIAENYYNEGQTTLDSMANGKKKYATDPEWANKIAGTMKGAEGYTSPNITVQASIQYNGTGDPEADGRAIGKGMGQQINNAFTQEQKRLP